jgi:endonuclease-8
MPEGHTIRRLALDQASPVGRPVRASSPQGRFAEGAATLDGQTLDGIDAFAKLLFHAYGDSRLHVHFGTQGIFLRHLAPATRPRPSVRLRLDFGTEAWELIAPLRCELMDEGAAAGVVAGLGPDPLRGGDRGEAWRRLQVSSRPVGVALLDQSVVAGVGNVLRTEALAACGVHPSRPVAEVTRGDFDCLWDELVRTMSCAVAEGRIVTVDAPLWKAPPAAEARYAYKQAACRRCGDRVESWTLAGRTAHACPTCRAA